MKQFYWLLLLMLFGCTTLDTREHAEQLAHGAGLTRSQITANGFVLTAYSRLTNPEKAVNVYILKVMVWLGCHGISFQPTQHRVMQWG